MGRGDGKGDGLGKGRGDGKGEMLQAQKNALQASLTENMIQLEQQELSYYVSIFSTIGQTSAILGGFAFTGGLVRARASSYRTLSPL